MLLLKATSKSAIDCIKCSVALLQEIGEYRYRSQLQQNTQDCDQKSVCGISSTNLKGSRSSGLFSRMTLARLPNFFSRSMESYLYANNASNYIASNNSLYQVDGNVANIKDLGAKPEICQQVNKLCLKSSSVLQWEQRIQSSTNTDEN